MASLVLSGCGALPHDGAPAQGYVFGSGEPLRVAVLDETGRAEWSGAVNDAMAAYQAAAPLLQFQRQATGAHIVVTVRRYRDDDPPALEGYRFQSGVGGFAAVYDAEGRACNFPPSPLPMHCSGEIARAGIYLNDIIPPGDDIEERRLRLVLHELGHALGLTRHSADLGIPQLAQRYGWPE